MKKLICSSILLLSLFSMKILAANIANDPVTTNIRKRSQVNMAHYLTKHPQFLNKINKLGMTPVMVAVTEKNLKSLKEILSLKPDLEIRGFEDHTALELSLDEPDIEIVEALLEGGAIVNATDPETGSTALHQAVRSQNLELIKVLLKYGAKKENVNKNGDSPLSLSQDRQMRKVYQLLTNSLDPAK